MGLATTVCRRSLLGRPGRTLLSVLGIAVGIATVVGVYVLDHNTIVSLSKKPDERWTPALEVNPGAKQEARETLRELASVSEVVKIFRNDVELFAEPKGPQAEDLTLRARLLAVETASIRDFDTYVLQNGRDLDPRAPEPEVLIGTRVAETLNVTVGDVLELAQPRRAARKECIEGEVRTVGQAPNATPERVAYRVVGVLAREKLGWTAKGEIVIVDYERGATLFEGARIADRFWVRQKAEVDIETTREELSKNFAYDYNKKALVGQAADERAYRNGVRLAGLLALVLGLYVIFHTLSMSLVERVREIGLLHAVGATRGAIARVFLLEAVVVSGVAGLLGLLGGLGLARLLIHFDVSTLGTGRGRHIHGFVVPWGSALGLVALGFGVALVGSVYPLLRVRQSDSVAAVRGEQAIRTAKSSGVGRGFHLFAAILVLGLLPGLYFVIVPVVGKHQGVLVGVVLGAVGVMSLLLLVPLLVPKLVGWAAEAVARPFERLFPLAGRLVSRGMRVGRTRIAFSAAAVALVVAAFFTLKNMTASLTGEVELWAQRAFADKVYVENLPDVEVAALREALQQVDGVLGLEVGSTRTHGSFLLLGTPIAELRSYGPLKNDAAAARLMEEGHGILISKRLSNADGYEVGDTISITVGGGRVQEFRVAGVTDDYGYFPFPDERLYGVVADHRMQQYFCQDIATAHTIAVRLEKGTRPGVVTDALKDHYGSIDKLRITTGKALFTFHRR
ncbi:MAG: ABC transporter permease, partial [Planctomycetota bacterium]